jgi:hypothetical protein
MEFKSLKINPETINSLFPVPVKRGGKGNLSVLRKGFFSSIITEWSCSGSHLWKCLAFV